MLQMRLDVCSFSMHHSITPGVCRLQLSFRPDHTLALPESFANIETCQVRFMTMEDAAAALERYEGVIRKELETPSELDRFCALPESKRHLYLRDSTHSVSFQSTTTSRFAWLTSGIAKSMGWRRPQSSVLKSKTMILEIGRSS